ncbi:MAG: hypothetical protein JWM93_1090 [Frankiales bacterium]|nr:hypothetical protein [Frankiales bacterium]
MTNPDTSPEDHGKSALSPMIELLAIQAILECASDVTALVASDLTVKWVSPALQAFWGYTVESVLGARAGHTTHPDDLPGYRSMLTRVAEVPGAHDRAEVRMRSAGGSWRWVEQRVTNKLGEDGVDALVVTSVDIDDRRRTEDELDRLDRFYRAVFDGATDTAVVTDADTSIRWVSPSVPASSGHDPSQIVGTKVAGMVHPEDLPAFQATLARVRARAGARASVESRLLRADGAWRWSKQRITNLLDDPAVAGLVFNIVDITDRREASEYLHGREQFLRLVLEKAHDGVWVLDATGRTRFANERMADLLGVALEELVDRELDDVVDAQLAQEIRDRVVNHKSSAAEDCDLLVHTREGQPRWLLVSSSPLAPGLSEMVPGGGAIALVADITERKANEDALRRQALYDTLTGLPNRALLDEQRRILGDRLTRTGENYSYLLCDIDGLKLVNDALGGGEGDRLIQEVARRLAETARPGDTVGRATGAQFVVLCPGTESFQAQRIAHDLVVGVDGPLQIAGSTVWPTISVGAASTSDVTDTGLASAADSALVRAKRSGRSSVAVFDAAAPRDHRSTLEMLTDLHEAASTGGLRLHYQPIVRLDTNEVSGAEALMRWNRPGHGEVPPSVFIPLAEEAGLIAELGAWSLHQACGDAAGWPGELAVAVNLSARQLTVDVVDTVRAALRSSGLAPHRLWLEVTETAVFTDVPAAADNLRKLAALGVHISLDDFGTGYSSLVYLRDFPVHSLKIDRSFVAGLGKNPDDTAIVATLISLGQSLSLGIVAEGVETPEQMHRLRWLGCEYAQGYLWSKPVPNAEFVDTIGRLERQGDASRVHTSPAARPGMADVTNLTAGRIMSMHRQGASPSSIAARLNIEGVSAPGGKRWHHVSVAHVITDGQVSRDA